MSKENPHIDQLLQQWLSGEARREEAGQLERIAADDPFVADAMEGYSDFQKSEHTQQVDHIRNKLHRTTTGQRTVQTAYYVRRIAAGLAVLAVASIAFWFISKADGLAGVVGMQTDSAEKSVAAEPLRDEARLQASDSVVGDTAGITPRPTAPPLTEEQQRERIALRQNEQLEAEQAQPDVDGVLTEAADDAPIAADNEAPNPINALPTSPPASVQSRTDEGEEADQVFSQANAAYIAPNERIIDGIVTDETGQPLIGANVLVPGTNIGTVTDYDGSFQLKLDKAARDISISYIGYDNKRVALGEQDKLNIAMDSPAVALDEVKVTGQSRPKQALREATTTSGAVLPVIAQPKGGFRKLERHIRRNQQAPADVPEEGGTVTVQFLVNPDGTLSNLEILRSNCTSCNPEAIRLLQSGPEWILQNADQAVIRNYDIKLKKQ